MEQNTKLEQNVQEEMNLEKSEETLVDKRTYEWKNNKVIGNLVGVVCAAIAIVAHLFHVAVSQLLFDSNERLDIVGVFQRSMAKSRNNLENTRENPNTDPDKLKKEEPQKSEPNKETTENTKSDEKDQKISPEVRDKAINQLFNSKEVKNIFRDIGLEAVPQQDTDNIVLFQTKTIDNIDVQKKVCAMSKDELLKGNANSLATAMFHYQNEINESYSDTDILTAKAESAIKAAAVVAAINYQGNKEEFDKAILNNETFKLSTVQLEDKYGASTITLESSALYKNMVDIKVNGMANSCVEIDNLSNETAAKHIVSHIMEQNRSKEFEIGSQDKLKFIPSEKGIKVMCVNRPEIKLSTGEVIEKQKNVNLGTYKFDSEKDIERLHQSMAKNKIVTVFDLPDGTHKTVDMASLAYVAAILNNPDIRPYANKEGEYLDPIDGKYQKAGASHLFVEHTENGVALKMFHPQQGAELSDVMICQYHHLSELNDKNIVQIAEAVEEAHGKCMENEYIKPNHDRIEHEAGSYGTKFESPIIVSDIDVEEVIHESIQDSILQGEEMIFNVGSKSDLEENIINSEEQSYEEAVQDVLNQEQIIDLTPENMEKLQAEVQLRQDIEYDFYDDDYR